MLLSLSIHPSSVYLEAHRHHGSTDLLPHHELLAQHGQDEVLPAARRQAFPQPDDPLPAHLVGIVLEKQAEF